MKSSGSSGGGSAGSGSSDEMKRLVKLRQESSSDITSTDPSSSEQSCDTVIYVGDRDDDEGTDAEHPPVYIPNLNSGDNRGLMSKVLKGSTAEVKQKRSSSRGSTLERKRGPRQRSPMQQQQQQLLSPCSTPRRLRPGSVGSTPTRGPAATRLSACQMNSSNHHVFQNIGKGGSLPRNPKGKMPLYGKVAGYRQPPSAAAAVTNNIGGGGHALSQSQEYWIDQPQVLQAQSRESRQVIVMQQQQQGGSSQQDWVNSSFEQQQQQQQVYDSSSSTGGGKVYGYMDDHKKNMIQQWVECQAVQKLHQQQRKNAKMPVVQAPAMTSSNSCHKNGFDQQSGDRHQQQQQPGPEPFAWLKQQGGEINGPDNGTDGCCKVLTQFKTVESSSEGDESFSSAEYRRGILNNSASFSNSASGKSNVTLTTAADVHHPHPRQAEDEGDVDYLAEADSIPPSPAVSSAEMDEKEEHEEEAIEKEGQQPDEVPEQVECGEMKLEIATTTLVPEEEGGEGGEVQGGKNEVETETRKSGSNSMRNGESSLPDVYFV